VPWYQPLAEMQAFSELTGGGLDGLWVWYARPGMSRRGGNSICSRLGSATVGLAQVSSSAVSAVRTSFRTLVGHVCGWCLIRSPRDLGWNAQRAALHVSDLPFRHMT
jgi:hypothetical protein